MNHSPRAISSDGRLCLVKIETKYKDYSIVMKNLIT